MQRATSGPRAGRKVCWIAVDFGTTAIQLAVQYKGEDAPVVVCEDEPSAVFFAKAGWILCGTDAVDASSKHAGRLLRCLKALAPASTRIPCKPTSATEIKAQMKRITGETQRLRAAKLTEFGIRTEDVGEEVADSLDMLVADVGPQAGVGFFEFASLLLRHMMHKFSIPDSTEAALAYPMVWSKAPCDVLRAAAARAGLKVVKMAPEPHAIAIHCMKVLGRSSARPPALSILDLGGGTFDMSLMCMVDIQAEAATGKPTFVRLHDDSAVGRYRIMAHGGNRCMGSHYVQEALLARVAPSDGVEARRSMLNAIQGAIQELMSKVRSGDIDPQDAAAASEKHRFVVDVPSEDGLHFEMSWRDVVEAIEESLMKDDANAEHPTPEKVASDVYDENLSYCWPPFSLKFGFETLVRRFLMASKGIVGDEFPQDMVKVVMAGGTGGYWIPVVAKVKALVEEVWGAGHRVEVSCPEQPRLMVVNGLSMMMEEMQQKKQIYLMEEPRALTQPLGISTNQVDDDGTVVQRDFFQQVIHAGDAVGRAGGLYPDALKCKVPVMTGTHELASMNEYIGNVILSMDERRPLEDQEVVLEIRQSDGLVQFEGQILDRHTRKVLGKKTATLAVPGIPPQPVMEFIAQRAGNMCHVLRERMAAAEALLASLDGCDARSAARVKVLVDWVAHLRQAAQPVPPPGSLRLLEAEVRKVVEAQERRAATAKLCAQLDIGVPESDAEDEDAVRLPLVDEAGPAVDEYNDESSDEEPSGIEGYATSDYEDEAAAEADQQQQQATTASAAEADEAEVKHDQQQAEVGAKRERDADADACDGKRQRQQQQQT